MPTDSSRQLPWGIVIPVHTCSAACVCCGHALTPTASCHKEAYCAQPPHPQRACGQLRQHCKHTAPCCDRCRILSRTNIFKPLLQEAYDKVVQQEVVSTLPSSRREWRGEGGPAVTNEVCLQGFCCMPPAAHVHEACSTSTHSRTHTHATSCCAVGADNWRPLAPTLLMRDAAWLTSHPLHTLPPTHTHQAAMATGAGVKQTWDIKYLYDGDCSMCRTLKAVLERQDGRRGRIAFINIADLDYDPYDHMGIEYDEAMDTIHSITKEGKVKGERGRGIPHTSNCRWGGGQDKGKPWCCTQHLISAAQLQTLARPCSIPPLLGAPCTLTQGPTHPHNR